MMEWNVYRHNINRKKMEVYNIFDHSSFREDVEALFRECTEKEEFAERLKRILSYYFWCKAEHEIIIAPWVGGDKKKEAEKIDIYSQVMNNFDVFINYCWEERLKYIIEHVLDNTKVDEAMKIITDIYNTVINGE